MTATIAAFQRDRALRAFAVLNVLNVADAIMTLAFVHHGGQELNPLMALLLAIPVVFLVIKVAMVWLLSSFLAYLDLAWVLEAGVLLYSSLVGYEVFSWVLQRVAQ